MITCLMPIYNRVGYLRILSEAVESFIKQDYTDKELLICNDTPGQYITCDHPQIKVVNVDKRFDKLGNKLRFMIEMAEGDYLCRWDDDDISLPHRLSYSIEKLGSKLEWHPGNYWYYPTSGPEHCTHPGNTHVMAIFRKELVELMGGYPVVDSGCEDQAFNNKLDYLGHGVVRGPLIPPKEIYYMYRWGVTGCHLSGQGGGEKMQEYYDFLGRTQIKKGTFNIEPKWHEDYVKMSLDAASRVTPQ